MTDSDEPNEETDLVEVLDEIDDLIVAGDLEEAAEAVDQAIETYGEDEELLLLRAEVALENDEYQRCASTVDESTDKVEDDEIEGHLLELKGYSLFYLDELDRARRTFNEAIRTGGASWTALVGRAMVHEEMSYFRAAMLDLDRAIAIDDQEAQPFSIRGQIHLHRGDLEEAHEDLAHAVSLDPWDEEARLDLARLQAQGGETSAAIETLEPLVEEGEEPACVLPAALLRSQLSLTLGSTDAAVEDAEKAVEVAPDEPWGHLQIAACRLSAMDAGEAIAAVKEAEEVVDDPQQIPDAFALRASAYEQLDKPEKARRMRDKSEGTAKLPGIVYGDILNPARNVPLNPDKSIDAQMLMEQLFDDPSEAPDGYKQALQQVVDQIPERLEENPDAEKIRVPLPQFEGMDDTPKSLVLQVNQGN